MDGFLTEYGSVDQLADRLALLADDVALRLAMGRHAFRRVESTFLRRHMRENWIQMLRQLTDVAGR